MKYTDDYLAKYKIWAAERKVHSLPRFTGLPPFKSKKFNTYEEYNAWKEEYLREIARNGGVRWLSEVRGAGILEFTPQVEEIFFKV